MDQKALFDHVGHEYVFDRDGVPICHLENLYQAIKARLVAELAASHQVALHGGDGRMQDNGYIRNNIVMDTCIYPGAAAAIAEAYRREGLKRQMGIPRPTVRGFLAGLFGVAK